MSQPTTYALSARVMHWAMALLLLSMIFAGLAMVQSLQPWHLTLLGLHKSFGVIALLAVIVRLIIRLRNATPALPDSIPAMQKRIAHASHWLLYAAMFAMPLSGYFMQNAAGRPVAVFDWFTLPALLPESLPLYGFFREMHALVAWALIALLLIHIAAALHHGLVKRDGVLQSMTGRKQKQQ
ncbi:cytochrome B [Aliidiomarina iranensis]|uniref:Cytochrome B n=1 Tax=Aliidiomarina iranensis TaxID=1434071 RepID=A0A432VWG1_9GAMM|nr:cytochrome b [Aliidiomarina iranensis]RUO20895.1 cytochrome B [Aliidiomarina iranensis]